MEGGVGNRCTVSEQITRSSTEAVSVEVPVQTQSLPSRVHPAARPLPLVSQASSRSQCADDPMQCSAWSGVRAILGLSGSSIEARALEREVGNWSVGGRQEEGWRKRERDVE